MTIEGQLNEFKEGVEKFRELALDQEEIQCKHFSLSIRGSTSDNGHNINSCKPSSQTRLDSNVLPHINNLDQQKILLAPLIRLIDNLQEKIVNKKDKSLCHRTIHQQLLTGFFVFKCYNLLTYQDKCAKLAGKLRRVSIHESLTTCIMNLSIALDAADMDRASRAIKEGEVIVQEVKKLQNNSDTFDTIHFFILKCDFMLRLGKTRGVAEQLKALLSSDYFAKSTVNRFYLKAFALYTASKFPGDTYTHSISLEEFSEPLFMCYTIIRTWNRSVYNVDSSVVIKPTEPLWFQYAMYWLFFTSYDLFAQFNINIDNPLETEFFHNYALSICRQNCFLFWIQKLLVTSATVDWLTDKPDHAMTKADLSLHFTRTRNMTEHLQKRTDSSNHEADDETDDESEVFTIKTTLKSDSQDISGKECLHTLEVNTLKANLHNLKKSTMKVSADQDVDDSLTASFDLTKIISTEPAVNDIYKSDAVRLEALILLVLLHYSSPRDRMIHLHKIQITSCIKNSLNLVRNVAKTTVRSDLSAQEHETIRIELLECVRDLLTFRLRLWINRIYIESLELIGDAGKARSLASSFFEKSFKYRVDCFEGYSSRAQLSALCSIYSRLLFSSTVPLPEYNPATAEEITASAIKCQRSTSTSSSPPRSDTRSSQRKPKKMCPPLDGKCKKAYKMPEMQEYYQKLGQVICNEKNLPRISTSLTESPAFRYKQLIDQISASAPSAFEKTVEKKVVSKRRVDVKVKDTKKSQTNKIDQVSSELASLSVDEKETCCDIFSLASSFASDFKSNGNEITSSTEKGARFCETLIKYMGSHPPAHFYRDVQLQIALDHLLHGRLNQAGHHLSEMAAVAFRYHAIRIANKRTPRKKSVYFEASQASFIPSENLVTLDQHLTNVPDSWRIVQISVIGNDKPGPSLLVTRFQKSMPPVVLKIKSTPQKHTKNFIDELVELLEQSNSSIIDKDPDSFWKVRCALDARLKELLKSIEIAWLGPWKGLFIGTVSNPGFNKFIDKLTDDIITEAADLKLEFINKPLLRVLIESISLLDTNEFTCGMATILTPFSLDFSTLCYHKVRKAIDKSDFKKIFSSNSLTCLEPVGLILNSGLDILPWECLPTPLSLNQQYFRIPSLRFLSVLMLRWKNSITLPESTYYLLNPANNLHKTQIKFEEKFKSMDGWIGCIGQPPQPDNLLHALEERHVYIFFGHGAGSCYYRKLPSNLEGVDIRTVSLVIGCSSGRLRREGNQLETHGTPWRFLLNGSPSFLGVLWDVTDVDIDSYSDSMLSSWLPSWIASVKVKNKVTSLSHAATKARQACKLKYIIGAAPVVYGLPMACGISFDKMK